MTRRVLRTVQQGFTLIELVIVLVILGILAAVAVPKYVDLTGSANTAAVQSVAGAITSASAINYAAYATTTASGGTFNGAGIGAAALSGNCASAPLSGYLSGILSTPLSLTNAGGAASPGAGVYTIGGTIVKSGSGSGTSVTGCWIALSSPVPTTGYAFTIVTTT